MANRRSKPWLDYKQDVPDPPHLMRPVKPKTVFQARMLMLFLGQLGVQRFYIGEIAGAWRWILGMLFGPIMVYILVELIALESRQFDNFMNTKGIGHDLFVIITYSPFIAWIIIEWRTLPKRVEAWNKRHYV